MLARLCGWEITKAQHGELFGNIFDNNLNKSVWKTATGNWPNLYHPANMALAKRVMMWAENNLDMEDETLEKFGYTFTFHSVSLALDGVLVLAVKREYVVDQMRR